MIMLYKLNVTTVRTELRQRAVDLRTKHQLSYSEIRKRLGVSKSTLSYWLQEYPLTAAKILELRRKGWQKGEASREKYRLTMRKKQEALDQNVYDEQHSLLEENLSKQNFYIAGLMLYLAEGAKRKKGSIVLANTDPRLIRFFIKWMDEFLSISRSSVKVQLHLYENMDIRHEKAFWCERLGIKDSQLYKHSVRKLKKNSFSYESTNRHGTCSLYAFGVDKARELMMAMKAFVDIYLGKR